MKASLPYKYITSVKNGKQYVVFDYKDSAGKRKRKWVNTELPEKCTKKALKEAVDQIVAEFDEQFRTGTIGKTKAKSAVDVPSGLQQSDRTLPVLHSIRTRIPTSVL